MDDTESIVRKWLLEEATRNGPEVHATSGPSSVQRWPLRSVTDPAYLEDACDYCGETLGRLWLNTGNGPHHKDCWIERTTPGNREEAR